MEASMPGRNGCCWWRCALLTALVGCTGQVSTDAAGSLPGADAGPDGGIPDAGTGDAGSGADGGTVAPPQGTLSGALRIDNFGWRPADTKVAVLLAQAGAAVQLIDASTGASVGNFTSSSPLQTDAYSGDGYSTVDFSAFSTSGDYYLYVPSLNVRSYGFRISEDIYDVVGAASVKAYYFQRCNHDKALPFATDALLGYSAGGQWVDGACHATDANAPAGPGSANNGLLDVHGGWHDAGDYQKTLWGRGVPQMLFAYEVNPGAWTDGQLHIPESGNGIPDLLDEVRWELDFYVRMQRPDGHFMTSTKGNNATVTSPPSASNEGRVYFDCTSPSGNGWSGGGVTIAVATGNAVLALAHAAIVFKSIGQNSIASGYAAAAVAGWNWLHGYTASGSENELKASAASAVFRMDPTQSTAQSFVDAFPWDTWDGMIPNTITPGEGTLSTGAWHYLMNASGTSSVKAKIQAGCRTGLGESGLHRGRPLRRDVRELHQWLGLELGKQPKPSLLRAQPLHGRSSGHLRFSHRSGGGCPRAEAPSLPARAQSPQHGLHDEHGRLRRRAFVLPDFPQLVLVHRQRRRRREHHLQRQAPVGGGTALPLQPQ